MPRRELTQSIWFVAVFACIRTGDNEVWFFDRRRTRLLTLEENRLGGELVRKLVL